MKLKALKDYAATFKNVDGTAMIKYEPARGRIAKEAEAAAQDESEPWEDVEEMAEIEKKHAPRAPKTKKENGKTTKKAEKKPKTEKKPKGEKAPKEEKVAPIATTNIAVNGNGIHIGKPKKVAFEASTKEERELFSQVPVSGEEEDDEIEDFDGEDHGANGFGEPNTASILLSNGNEFEINETDLLQAFAYIINKRQIRSLSRSDQSSGQVEA